MKFILATTFSLLFIWGCRPTPNVGVLQTVTFDINTSYEISGTFFDKSADEERICFVKKNFNPNLKILNADGVVKDSVSLVEVEKAIGKISAVWIDSMDSIYVLSTSSQTVAIFDRNGSLLQKTDLKEYNSDGNGNIYDLYPPFLQSVQMGLSQEIVLTTFWLENTKNPKANIQDRSLDFVTDNIRNGYLMRKISPTSDISNNCFGVRITDFKELSDLGKSLFLPFYKTIILNGRYFLTSHYSRYIYELDDDLTIKNAIKIIPDDYPLSYPVPLSEKDTDITKKEVELDGQGKNSCYIVNICYNKSNDSFVVIVKNGTASDDLFAFPFDVYVYNGSFDKMIGKHSFASNDHIPKSSFILSGKLYIEKTNTSYESKVFEVVVL